MSIKIKKKDDAVLFDNWDKCGLNKSNWVRLSLEFEVEVESIPEQISDMVNIV